MFIGYVNKLRSNYDTLQAHILINLFKSFCKFLCNAYRSCNIIVKTCMNNAVYNSNTCIRYKLSFFSKYLLFRYEM